jgi:threonine dehydratase
MPDSNVSLPNVSLGDIQAARKRIGDAIYHSPCPYSLSLSRLCGCEIYCKLDHLQMTGSFKERGARNKLLQLPAQLRAAGVIAASAGNHALGLAYHGQLLSIPVTVVMPRWAPLIKVSNCRSFGATVILHGDTFDDARKLAIATAAKKNQTFIPGFDDPDIIAGQGTMGLEILEDVPDLDAVIIPVGGGGLLAGVGTAIKALRPQTRIIAVEPSHAPTLDASLRAGKVTRIETKPTLADGLAVAEIGSLCFQMIKGMIDRVHLVDEAQIAKAILRLLELEKTVVEGAGAVPLAAIANRSPNGNSLGLEGKKVVLVLCGGNIDVTLISRIIERGLAADGRLCRITAAVTDRPGGLAHLAKVIAACGASIKEVHHDRNFGPPDIARVYVSCVLETRDFAHIKEIEAALRKEGFEISIDDSAAND